MERPRETIAAIVQTNLHRLHDGTVEGADVLVCSDENTDTLIGIFLSIAHCVQICKQFLGTVTDGQITVVFNVAGCRNIDGVRKSFPHVGTIQRIVIVFSCNGRPCVVAGKAPDFAGGDCWAERLEHGLNRLGLVLISYTDIKVIGK